MNENIDCLAAALELISEPAALSSRGKIVYLNPPAKQLTGRETADFPLTGFLPEHVVSCQAPAFVTGGFVAGKRCTIRADAIGSIMVYLFTPDVDVSAPGLFCALPQFRKELLNLKLVSDSIVSMASLSGDEKFSQYSAVLSHSYYELKRLVQNISVIEGLVRNELPFSPAMTDVSELCRDIVSAVAPFAARSGVELRFDCSDDTAAAVDGDLIELLVLNLLTNSLAHTPQSGVVKLRVSEYPGGVMIAIDDTGSGIPPETMKTVFSRYCELLSLSEMTEGPGLGLAIARGIAEKHGGAFIIESRKGSGASVRASVVKGLVPSDHFQAAESAYVVKGMDIILTQLSPWLPSECYQYEYDE